MDHLPTMASKKSSLSIDEKGGGVGSILTPADIRVGGYYFGHNSMSSATREMIFSAKCRACGEAANAR